MDIVIVLVFELIKRFFLQPNCLYKQEDTNLIKDKGLGSIRGYFGLNILGNLNTFVHLVLYLHNVNDITCF